MSFQSGSHILRCPYPDVTIPTDIGFGHFILEETKKYGNKVAFIDEKTGEKTSFTELGHDVRRYASAMVTKGLRKDDVVLFFAPNSVSYPIALYGNAYVGLISATANPNYTPGELRYMIDDSRPLCIMTTDLLLPTVLLAVNGYTENIEIILLKGHRGGYKRISDVIKTGNPAYESSVTFDPQRDVCFLPYSSGTTGLSKGVCLTHYNMVANIYQTNTPMFYPGYDLSVTFLPFFHSFGLGVVLGVMISQGTTIVVMEKFDFKGYLRSIERYKADVLNIVPPVAVLLAKDSLTSQYNLTSVRFVHTGAGPIGEETEKEVMLKTGIRNFYQGYGLTETSPVVTQHPIGKSVSGSVGKPVHNTEIMVVDINDGHPLGPNKDGEILIRGPQVMKEYWRNKKATTNTLTEDGWLKTGDIGRYDDQGYIYILDRIKELIKWKGEQVPPAELESLILQHPTVADVAVIGVPDLDSGELPRAYVVRKPKVKVTAPDIANFVKDNAAPHKRLRGGVEFLDEIPKSPSGKILRRVLRDKLQQRMKSKL